MGSGQDIYWYSTLNGFEKCTIPFYVTPTRVKIELKRNFQMRVKRALWDFMIKLLNWNTILNKNQLNLPAVLADNILGYWNLATVWMLLNRMKCLISREGY